MQRECSPRDYARYVESVEKDEPIDPATADGIAAALLRWAQRQGATHFTHWFQPILEGTAQKHDTFLDTQRDGETPLFRLAGKHLLLGEPDGSSFPSGGMRETHHARGYTTWDPHSPPFLLEHEGLTTQRGGDLTLYIPTVFYSWKNAAALDEKIPLLRSEAALRREALALLRVMGEHQHKTITTDSGLEQEFFIIKREYYNNRIDLITAGRTVLGAPPPKGQELEDQYFGAMSDNFLTFIKDVEDASWQLGIPIQTRHREVAPGQYEIAPKFAPGTIATDRNLIMMELLRRISRRHHLAVLLSEKPFKGVNGSGKHNNWSIGSDTVPSFLTPGDDPCNNIMFMVFLAATIRAIDLHGDLMRIAVSGAGNDHRLGANEAPPAIVSVYLGDDIEAVVKNYIAGKKQNAEVNLSINLGIPTLPALQRSPTDRNRTSTFAFTGNKFEFRAVGASQNPSRSNQILNTIVADSLRFMALELAALLAKNIPKQEALETLVRDVLTRHQRIIFNGNGYSQQWQEEAARRGLPNLRTTPDALKLLLEAKNVAIFEEMGVMSRKELEARETILYEEYAKKIAIEANCTAYMVSQQILPSSMKHQTNVANSILAAKNAGVADDKLNNQKIELNKLSSLINDLAAAVSELKESMARYKSEHEKGPETVARFALDVLIPAMARARAPADALELIVPDWPFPTYHDMMFHQD